MKVKCINTDYLSDFLTNGKTYEVTKVANNNTFYCLINDKGGRDFFPKKWFKPLSEMRNETIDKLLK